MRAGAVFGAHPVVDILIIGTSHRFQQGTCTVEAEQAFISFLNQCCVKHKAALVAEEMCAVLMAALPGKESTCLSVARKLLISHAYCEPPEAERPRLGIRGVQSIEVMAFHEGWTKRRKKSEIADDWAVRESSVY